MVDQSRNKNFKLLRNDNIEMTLTIKEDGVAVDITGWTFFFTVKSSQDDVDGSAVITKDWSSHTDPTNGETLLSVPAASTNLTGDYYYDIQYKDGAGKIHTILYGRITFDKDITIRTS